MTPTNKDLAPLTRELLTPREQADIDYKAMMHEVVREHIAELLADKESAELEPFFRSREVSDAMKRNQTVIERNGWAFVFADHGCMICQRTDVPHCALGMCGSCFSKVRERRRVSIRARESEPGQEVRFKDTVKLAREALLPSIEKLARKRKGQ